MIKIKELSKNNKKHLITLLLVLTVCFILAFGFKMYNLDNKKHEKELNNLNMSVFRIKEYIDKNVSNREMIIEKEKIRIGENKKQIENGYYDLEIYIENNKNIVVVLNKLWKEFDEKLYQEEYIREISNSINCILQVNNRGSEIYDYIILGYTLAKSEEEIDKLNEKYILDINGYRLKGKIQDKQFVISIYLNN